MEGRFKGRDIVSKPTCPFCGLYISKPQELITRMPNEMPLGMCNCGAVYACDVTGHNLGTAMVEALVFSCDSDWDLAWNLLPEEDYLTMEVKHYDLESHQIIHSSAYQGRNVSGVLYFVKLHTDILEVTEDGFRKKIKKSAEALSESRPPKKGKKIFTKDNVEELVKGYHIAGILNLAKNDKRIIRYLQRLLYSADNLTRLRAADALGQASAVIAGYDSSIISKLLQNLFLSVTDTAASSWGAIDAIGEIIKNSPERFSAFTPQLYPFMADENLLFEVLRALANVTSAVPGPFQKIKYRIIPLLKASKPEIRAYASIILGNLSAKEAKQELLNLANDTMALEIYKEGSLKELTISDISSDAIQRIDKHAQ